MVLATNLAYDPSGDRREVELPMTVDHAVMGMVSIFETSSDVLHDARAGDYRIQVRLRYPTNKLRTITPALVARVVKPYDGFGGRG